MKAIKAVAVAGTACALMVPAASAVAATPAAPPANGATLAFQQFGVTTHRICVDLPFELVASGFAPNRHVVQFRIVSVGSGENFSGSVSLSGGAGSTELPPASGTDVGAKIRVRYQTGSSNHLSNLGSTSATFVLCVA